MKRMPLVLIAITSSFIATSAAAQTRTRQSAPPSIQYDIPPSQTLVPDREECLLNKVTKKNECHTRREWRKIAAKLGADQEKRTRQQP